MKIVLLFILIFFGCAKERIIEMPQSKCLKCHEKTVERWNMRSSSHSMLFTCDFCHEEKKNSGTSGHMTSSGCSECHTEIQHFPLIASQQNQCTVCHEPHGTGNIYLIKEIIVVEGKQKNIEFYSLEGKADYSFAEPGEDEGGKNGRGRGSGLCEVCHKNTLYYNNSGSSSPHYTENCIHCHKHTLGFYAGEK